MIQKKSIIDISPVISEKLAVFPGDQPFQRKMALSFAQGHHLELSSVQTTLHLGAHADSSSHYHKDGQGIQARALQTYFGLAQVFQVPQRKQNLGIGISDLNGKVECTRVLFRTESFPNPNDWNNDFMHLTPELIHFLAKQGVQLVGIDTPSVDAADSKDLPSHQALYATGMAVLEGLVLNSVSSGKYDLIALPLALEGCDASPVRAILLPKGSINS